LTHVDTSFLVDLVREAARGEHGRAHAMLDELAEEPLAVSVFVACELHAGAELTKDPDGERGKIDGLPAALETVPPDEGFARRYGKTLAELRRRGRPISTMGLLIAVTALGDEAPLVTRNVEDFARVPGLLVKGY
jgi:predicted nucleic acid-binding protein